MQKSDWKIYPWKTDSRYNAMINTTVRGLDERIQTFDHSLQVMTTKITSIRLLIRSDCCLRRRKRKKKLSNLLSGIVFRTFEWKGIIRWTYDELIRKNECVELQVVSELVTLVH